MNLNKAFDQTLKDFGITAKWLSGKSGVAPQIISDFRRGKKAIQTDNLEKLLKFLPIEAQAHFFSLSVGGNLTSEKIMLSLGKDWKSLISTASPGDIEEILRAVLNRYSELKNDNEELSDEMIALSAWDDGNDEPFKKLKTDSIFYRLFQEFPDIFFELIGRGSFEARDYEFTSVEVKQLAFRMDGLFLPKTKDFSHPFYIVEVQFQPDQNLYYRLFSELFLYLRQYQPSSPWIVVVIYPSRSIEREQELHFSYLLASPQVRRIYLDELRESADASLGVGVVKLVIETEETVAEKARVLIERAKQQLEDEVVKGNLIDLIETIIVYKLPKKSREEIEAMLGLSELKQTKVYQEAQLEAKLEAVPELLKEGLKLEQIARALKLPLKVVQQAAQEQKSNN